MGINEKAPTRGGQGWESGLDTLFSYVKAAVVKVSIALATIGRAGGVQ